MNVSRRQFIKSATTAVGATFLGHAAPAPAKGASSVSPQSEPLGAIVICNHWTQYGIGETFPQGEIRGRWYQRNFSTVFGFEQGRRWLDKDPRNRVCHEYDAYFLDSLAAEDPDYLAVLRDLLDRRLMELPGGTFGQAESQVFGYESAIRQLSFGQAAYRRHLQRGVDTYIVEEQSFFPQLPQLLKQAGFKYASIQFQNSGTPDPSPHDLVLWEAPDGTALPTIPNHPGMLSCARQWKSYDEVIAQLAGRKAPLLFQWMEIWPPGLDWGASVMPYEEAIHALETKGYRQMVLTEYVEWALGRCEPPRIRIPLDQSNYNNNFFQGGWGYENEKTARGSNRCESLLMAAETLCAGAGAQAFARNVAPRLKDLWSRLLISQNHDPYLAGSIPAYVDGLRSYMSELAVKQLSGVQRELRQEGGLDSPVSADGKTFRLFNPCPWDVSTPVLLETDSLVWPNGTFTLQNGSSKSILPPVFRSDDGRILVGPVMVNLSSYGTADLRLEASDEKELAQKSGAGRLQPLDGGRTWKIAHDLFEGVLFEPLLGQWKQVPSYFTSLHPNINTEVAHTRIEEAPTDLTWRGVSNNMDAAVWRRDLMRIRDVEEPALAVQGLVFAGAEPAPFVQFNQRLTSTIRFETGARPDGTWRFRVRIPSNDVQIVADSPFHEEARATEYFYCARYIRVELPGRHLLWCPSQNTLFRRIPNGDATLIECTVLDFSYTGQASWEMRFHAARSFSAAESMRLAETFHRRPVRIPVDATAGYVAGIAVDNPNVLITHVFPSSENAMAVRLLNASNESQPATLRGPHGTKQALLADFEGNPIEPSRSIQWPCSFRPWEIATFRVSM